MLSYLFSNEKVRLKWSDVLITLLFFVFGLFVFTQMYRIQVDMFWHLRSMTIVIFDKCKLFRLNYDTLTRLGLYFLGFLTRKGSSVGYVCFLSLMLALKYVVIRAITIDYFSRQDRAERAEFPIVRSAIVFLCLGGHIIAFPQLASGYWQADVLRLNVWHNPTTVAVMPFALLLFYFGFLTLKERTLKNFLILAAVAVLNFFTKPSYILAWVPSIFLFFAFIKIDDENNFSLNFSIKRILIACAVAVPALAGIFLMKYVTKSVKEGVIFSLPFAVQSHLMHIDFPRILNFMAERLLGRSFDAISGCWQTFWYFLFYKPLTLLCGLAFPISVFFVSKKKKDGLLLFAWLTLAVSFAIGYTLSQGGDHRTHLNFTWQIPVAVSTLFLASLFNFFSDDERFEKLNWPAAITVGLFLLHAYSGLLYLQRMIFTWSWR
ncbi:hypothetical protein J6T93_08330 [bacterium]|nr:hypothetical protein [bacterium]